MAVMCPGHSKTGSCDLFVLKATELGDWGMFVGLS